MTAKLGTKRKYWFRENDQLFLFKADDRETGEDWAEVIACNLCALLDLPHVEYTLAIEDDGSGGVKPGVICENIATDPLILVLGNELLVTIDRSYPKAQKFKVQQHTVEAVVKVVSSLFPPSCSQYPHRPNEATALDVYTGYIMLDAWIANQDRHHETWGAIWGPFGVSLSPTFDHGAALARNLIDTERAERLTTRDRNRSVAAFCARGRSAVYQTASERTPMYLIDAFRAFAVHSQEAAEMWLERLAAVSDDDVWRILERIPNDRMSTTCRQFTFELLRCNRQRLLESLG